MKSVMISIRPKWCEKIVGGEKTIEVRKTRPKLETPFTVYIYCTSGRPDLNIPISPERLMQDYLDTGSMQSLNCPLGNGKVIGRFVCDKIYEVAPRWKEYIVLGEEKGTTNEIARNSCLSFDDMKAYLGQKNGYGWHVSDLEIYDRPMELSRFERYYRCDGCDGVFGGECNECYSEMKMQRPPQSWCYVRGIEEDNILGLKG